MFQKIIQLFFVELLDWCMGLALLLGTFAISYSLSSHILACVFVLALYWAGSLTLYFILARRKNGH